MNRFLPYACFLGLFCSFTFAADDYVLGIDSQPNPNTQWSKSVPNPRQMSLLEASLLEVCLSEASLLEASLLEASLSAF